MAQDDFRYSSASETAAALRAKKVSAVELTDAAIARIEKHDPVLNAVVVRDFDRARAAAKEADNALAAGKDGALLGVPITVKESYDLTGHGTTWGMEFLKEYRAPADSEVVRRLKGAGAILLGKTNIPVSLQDWQSVNPIYGRTVNPYNTGRSAGGSSGGSAVAVAAGYVPLEMGSDIGGSIRVPAAFNGIYGHKPTYGIVSLGGHAPGGMGGGGRPALAVGGPLARTADDVKLALDIVAGSDGDEATAWQLRLPPPRHTSLKGARVLILDTNPRCATAASMKHALAELEVELKAKGAIVTRESKLLPDLGAQFDVYVPMLTTIVTRNVPGAVPIDAFAWMGLIDQQQAYRRQWAELLKTVDVVVTPTFGRSAHPHNDDPDFDARTMEIDGKPTLYRAQLAWPSVALLPHLPATSFPIGFDEDGLPLGAQAIGAFGEDLTTIAFAGLAGRDFVPPKL